jgi:hypothetical protein
MLPIPPFAEVALLDRLPLPADPDLKRELLAAVVAAIATLGLLPRGRRQLAEEPVHPSEAMPA